VTDHPTLALGDDTEPSAMPTSPDGLEPEPGSQVGPSTIGRYEVRAELGRGGMGVVYRAHDPKLGRKVAIKLVGNQRRHASVQARERLAREARLMAQLSHPNVVEVFEIGTHGEQLFVAMELIDGEDLRAWSDDPSRTEDERLDAWTAAGRGLVAAHARGLVHRDFKPDNVMVGRDGRVRVLDFGLARAPGSVSASMDGPDGGELTASASSPGGLVSSDDRLTQTGLAMGTPAYMAPEQFRGAHPDPSCDQFAFCVTGFELLSGARPYAGETFAALARSTARGEIDPAQAAKVPPRILRVLRRGLSVAPGSRFESMEALLAELDRVRRGRRGPAIVGTALVGLGAVGLVVALREPEPGSCPPYEEARASVWPAAGRAAIEEAFTRTGLEYAESALADTVARIDAYADRWVQVRRSVCRGGQSSPSAPAAGEHHDATVDCLEQQRSALAATLEVLVTIDAASLHRASRLVADLPSPDACLEPDALARGHSPERAALLAELATIEASYRLGRYADGLEAIEGLGDGPARDDPVLVALVELVRGRLSSSVGASRASADALERAYFSAIDASRSDLACEAAAAIAGTEALSYQRRWTWARHAEAALVRHRPEPGGATTDRLGAAYEAAMCSLQRDSGDLADAIARCERALASIEADPSRGPDAVVAALSQLAEVAAAAEDHPRAHRFAKRAFRLAVGTWGTDHPLVADAATRLGQAALGLGRLGDAEQLALKAERIRSTALGPEHPDLALSSDLLAAIFRSRQQWSQAKAAAERGLSVREAAFGPTHPLVARSLYARALAEEKLEEYEQALRSMERVSEIDEQLHPLNIDRLPTLREQARMAFEFGEGPSKGRVHLERAWSIVEQSAIPADHPMVRDLNHGYGETLLALGEADAALPYLEAFVNDPRPHPVLPHLQFVLGRALQAAGRDPARARRLVEQALAAWSDSDDAFHREQVGEMRVWLAALPD